MRGGFFGSVKVENTEKNYTNDHILHSYKVHAQSIRNQFYFDR